MAFLETPRFPVTMSHDSRMGPRFLTDVVVYANGAEFRNSRWSLPLLTFNAAYKMLTRSQLIDIYDLFLVSKGRANGFRVKDFFDFTSAANGRDTPTNLDQTLGTANGVLTQFQLIKTYTKGANSINRTTKKPVASTTVVAVNSVAQTVGVDFTVDTTTGVITFTSAPSSGAVTAGFEFDVPCRFDIDDFSQVQIALNAASASDDVLSVGDIPLVELRNP